MRGAVCEMMEAARVHLVRSRGKSNYLLMNWMNSITMVNEMCGSSSFKVLRVVTYDTVYGESPLAIVKN